MLFNQDKYQNPVNILKNKFDIKSGATDSQGKLFGHTPIGGKTVTTTERNSTKRTKAENSVRKLNNK